MNLPIMLIMILLARMLLEASLNRQEVAVLTRTATHIAAAAESTSALYCNAGRAAFSGRTDVAQTPTVSCNQRPAEQGLSREDPFWDAVEDGANAWRDILRDVKPTGTPYDVTGSGNATVKLSGSTFLSNQDDMSADHAHLAPMGFWWNHREDSFAEGHDRVIWEELNKSESYKLFPEVFPSR